MVCWVIWHLIATEMVKDNDRLFRAVTDFGGSCVDWFQSKLVKINLLCWATVKKQDMALEGKDTDFFFLSVPSCYLLCFLNGKSPRLRVCCVFCGVSKLRLGKTYLGFSVALSGFKITILRRHLFCRVSISQGHTVVKTVSYEGRPNCWRPASGSVVFAFLTHSPGKSDGVSNSLDD